MQQPIDKWTGRVPTAHQPKRRQDEREPFQNVQISRSIWAEAKRRVATIVENGKPCTLRDYVESALIEKQARDGQEARS